jgi:hypothetical protein
MGNLKTLLQSLSDQAAANEREWLDRATTLQQSTRGWNMWESTEQEERAQAARQRECDALYYKAQTIRECIERVAQATNRIIGENIEIQFSKWNIQGN